jgi:flagellar L-ring protein precursor FlgH
MKNLLISAACLSLLPACTSVKEIGVPPAFAPVQIGFQTDDLPPDEFPPAPNTPPQFSLWQNEKANLFSDRRAHLEGDLLTVLIAIDDEAKLKNETDRDRTTKRNLGLTGSYDLNGVGDAFSIDGDLKSGSEFEGNGKTVRSETIRLSVAAVVEKRLANGNLLIRGSQEIRVNSEIRVLQLAGIVRPTDISPTNTIPYERIAEARISYGGRGRLSEMQQPPWGQQVLDIVSPF